MKRYLVLGASGLLGINLSLQLSEKQDVVGTFWKTDMIGTPFRPYKVDLSKPGEAKCLIEDVKPGVIVNCAALANIDICEDEPELADRLNAKLPEELAKATRMTDIKLVHISTDAVFDGKRGMYTEMDEPEPINIYARTKLAGEKAVAQENPNAIIARVNFYGWSLDGRRSLAEWIFDNLSKKKSIIGFTDVIFCPLHVHDLGELLIKMVDAELKGLYHVVSSECLSKFDFALRLAQKFDLESNLIQPSSWASAGLTATRSANLSLSVDKITRSLGCQIPGIQEGLRSLHQQHHQNYAQKIRKYKKDS